MTDIKQMKADELHSQMTKMGWTEGELKKEAFMKPEVLLVIHPSKEETDQ